MEQQRQFLQNDRRSRMGLCVNSDADHPFGAARLFCSESLTQRMGQTLLTEPHNYGLVSKQIL